MEDLHLALRLSLEGPLGVHPRTAPTRQEKGERTLGHEATTRILCENNVRIRQGILQVVEHNSDLAPLKPLMERELRRALRARRAAELQCASVLQIQCRDGFWNESNIIVWLLNDGCRGSRK